ncbi:MAG: response regulator [Candidatus Acidiferrales bacterium]
MNPIKILLIEDNRGDDRLIGDMLAHHGQGCFRLESVGHLWAALRRLGAGGVDLMLVDLSVPDGQGYETFSRVHAHAPWIPIVVLTSPSDEKLARSLLQKGAQDYLLKGTLDGRLLVRVLRNALERKQASLKLWETEQCFRLLARATSDVVWERRFDSNTLWYNQGIATQFGYSMDDNQRDDGWWQQRIHNDDRDRVLSKLEAVRSAGETYWSDQYRFQRADGSYVEVYDHGYLLYDALRRPRRMIGATLDLTERKQTEEAMQRSESQCRSLFENAPYGIYRASAEGRFLAVNPALLSMLGYDSEEELLHKKIGPTIFLDAAERWPLPKQMRGLGLVEGVEVRWKRKDGSPLTVRVASHAVCDKQGNLLYLEGLAEDVTQQRFLEEQLRLAQKMEAVGRLAGGIAHDFNNLLNVILGYTELLQEGLKSDGKLRGLAEEIYKAGRSAASLTHQLLAFSRQQVFELQEVSVNSVISDMEQMMTRLIGEDMELVTSLEPELGMVKADPGQLQQVIMNLAVNARDAMPEGGQLILETRNVELDSEYVRKHSVVRPGPYVMLAVSDSGVGMDNETQARVFEPFFTTKGLGKGTGLGLATVYGIVKQSGGFIWVYSEPGQGTTFKVYLPRHAAEVGASQQLESGGDRPAPLPGKETVLLVEDEPSVRSLTHRLLVRQGYTVLEAKDGDEALLVAEQAPRPVDLLLTDVVMPKMSGQQLAERLQTRWPRLKVLYMSGYTDSKVVPLITKENRVAYLQKPFGSKDLSQKVRLVLDSANGSSPAGPRPGTSDSATVDPTLRADSENTNGEFHLPAGDHCPALAQIADRTAALR